MEVARSLFVVPMCRRDAAQFLRARKCWKDQKFNLTACSRPCRVRVDIMEWERMCKDG